MRDFCDGFFENAAPQGCCSPLRYRKDSPNLCFTYHGARYYDASLLSSWFAVDPLADKYPGISPYAYCAWSRPAGGHEHRLIYFNTVNNPVKLVDPDGNDWYEVLNETTGEKEIKWTDYHSQEEMNNNKLTGTYLGKAGTYQNGTKGVSEGCLLIHGNQWAKFNAQLHSVNSFVVRVNRK